MWLSRPPSDPSKTVEFVQQCPCGFARSHGLIRKECEYSFAGLMMAVFFGGGSRPRKVTWRCPHCKTALAESRDPAILFDQG